MVSVFPVYKKEGILEAPLVVVMKARIHAVPSHIAKVELQNGLQTPVSSVTNFVAGHACGEVCEGSGVRRPKL